MILNTKRVKQINIDLIKSVLKSEEYSTKNSLSQATGLSTGTCRNILDELILTGEVKEIEHADSTGGRPSRRFVYNENFAYAAILYTRIEGSDRIIYCSIVNMLGENVYEENVIFDEISIDEIEQAVSKMTGLYPDIKVLSIGIPGIVHNGVIGLCDLKELSHTAIEEYLSDKFNIIVTAENDVNSTALGYYQEINDINPESMVYIYYPLEGIAGAGIIINGKILKGETDFAGEVSFIPLGVKYEDQGQIQKNSERFVKLVADTVQSVNSTINPERIVLSGKPFTDDLKASIQNSVREQSPEQHIPKITFEEDIHNNYVNGLKFSGLNKLSCGFEIVKK